MQKKLSLFLVTSLLLMMLSTSVSTAVISRGKPVYVDVTITAPTNGATVSDTVTIAVTTGNGVAPEIYINDVYMTTAFSYDWDTTSYDDGAVTIKAQLSRKEKDEISVTVSNGGTPPPPPPGGDGVVNKWAIIWGVSDYKAISDLSYCDDDARDWKNYLQGEQYSIEYCLIDSQATETAVKDAVADVISKADADDKIIYASSGHGGTSQGLYFLCTWDCGAGENGENGYILVSEFELMFANAPCETFIFLDHCSSGAFSAAIHIGIYLTTTCTSRGYGYDAPQYQNGMWTYWYLEAGLVGQGFDNAEDCFDWASAQYPFERKDAPQEFDMLDGVFVF
jgi:hypothetical protein